MDDLQNTPYPRKRLRIASSENEGKPTYSFRSTDENENPVPNEAILMVETTSDAKDDKEATAVIQAYNLQENKSYTLHSLTVEMITNGLCILMLRGKLCIFIKSGKLFHLERNKVWTELSATNDYHDVPVVEMDGYLYVLGAETEMHESCEKYDPTIDKWSRVGCTLKNSNFSCFVALNGWIYALGHIKCRGSKPCGAVKFNPESGMWIAVASPDIVKESVFATTFHGQIYVAGNAEHRNVSAVEMYNPADNIWTLIQFSTHPYSYLGLFTIDQTLVCVRKKSTYGACSKGADIATLNMLNKKWVTVEKLENASFDFQLRCSSMKVLGNYFISVQVEDVSFTCSLSQLIKKSDYFKAMFTHEMQENQTKIVRLLDVDLAAWKVCCRYIMEKYFPHEVDIAEFAEKLLHVARMLLLDDFVCYLSDYFGGKLSLLTFRRLHNISYKYDLLLLGEACENFASVNLKRLMQEPLFLSMEMNYAKHLLQSRREKLAPRIHQLYAIRCDGETESTIKASESDALMGVINWVNHDENKRRRHFAELLALIRIDDVELASLKNAIREPLLLSDRRCFTKFQRLISKRSEKHDVLLLRHTATHVFSAFLPKEKKWKPTMLPRLTTRPIHCFAVGDSLYALCGERKLFSLHLANLNEGWKERASMILDEDPCQFATTETGLLFVFGNKKAVKYDTINNVWSSVEILEPRKNFSATAFQEWIYILGGETVIPNKESTTLNTVIRYNTETELWHRDVAPMSKPRRFHKALYCSGKIFAIGGTDDEGSFAKSEKYDPETDTWTEIPELPDCKNNYTAVTLCHRICVTMHTCGKRTLTVYDTQTESLMQKNIRERLGHSSAVCVTLPYDYLRRFHHD